jgi:hypothetical protein
VQRRASLAIATLSAIARLAVVHRTVLTGFLAARLSAAKPTVQMAAARIETRILR